MMAKLQLDELRMYACYLDRRGQMATEILELREEVAELEAGRGAEEQHEQKRIARAIENLCVTINTPDIARIATALETLAGCVLCNAVSVTGALEVDAG